MDISKENFFLQAMKADIRQEKADVLWNALKNSQPQSQETTAFKFFYYLGSLIIISAMILFIGLNWSFLGGGGIFLVGLLYTLLFMSIGSFLWKNPTLRTPASLLITLAVCMVPLTIYGLQDYFHMWPEGNPGEYKNFYYIPNGNWILMEVGTILAAISALRYFPSSLLTIPLLIAGWYLTMDGAHVFGGEKTSISWMSLFYGLGLMTVGYLLDRKRQYNYAFWGYLFGTTAFWISLNDLVWNRSEKQSILGVYLVINFILLAFSLLLQRKILCIAGAIGVFAYFGHLASQIFENSIWFPITLSLIGLLMIYCGILYQKYHQQLQKWLLNHLPEGLKNNFFPPL